MLSVSYIPTRDTLPSHFPYLLFWEEDLLPLVKVIDRHKAATPLECLAKRRPVLDPLGLGVDVREADIDVLGQNGTKLQRITSSLRSPAFASYRTTRSGSVGATFQLGGKFGLDRCGGIEKTSLISLTSEERRTRPHIGWKVGSRACRPKRAVVLLLTNV